MCNMHTKSTRSQGLFLNQERVFPLKYDEEVWVLDTGATNHMTRSRASLASLDESVRGAMRFGDGSTVEICGVDAVTMATRNLEHHVLTEVYFIPSLRCNIISLGQLEEAGCRVEIDKGVLEVFKPIQSEDTRTIVIRVEWRNRLYVMKVNLTSLVCLLTKIEEDAWHRHAQFGHLNLRALHDLGAKEMVDGLPLIRKVEQVCDGCALGKQHCTPFSSSLGVACINRA